MKKAKLDDEKRGANLSPSPDYSAYVERNEQIAALEKGMTKKQVEWAEARKKASESVLDKQAEVWSEYANNINNSTVKWANSMMSGLENIMDGKTKKNIGKTFRQGSANILTDVSHAALQNATGGLVTGAASMLCGLLGGSGKKADGTADSPWRVKIVGADATDAAKGLLGDSAKVTGDSIISKFGTQMDKTTSDLKTSLDKFDQGFMDMLGTMGAGGKGSSGLLGWFAGSATGTGGISGANSSVPILGSFSMSLRAYANGGVATSPQLSLFGEAGPEAYVPLPDGRSIPVTMKSGGNTSNSTSSTGGETVNISITVNEAAGASQGGTTQTLTSGGGSSTAQWGTLATAVAGLVRTELANQQRPGGMLYQ